jgi:hypothetical protein
MTCGSKASTLDSGAAKPREALRGWGFAGIHTTTLPTAPAAATPGHEATGPNGQVTVRARQDAGRQARPSQVGQQRPASVHSDGVGGDEQHRSDETQRAGAKACLVTSGMSTWCDARLSNMVSRLEYEREQAASGPTTS